MRKDVSLKYVEPKAKSTEYMECSLSKQSNISSNDNQYENPVSETVVTHVGAPVAWGPRIIDTVDTVVATILDMAQNLAEHGSYRATTHDVPVNSEMDLVARISTTAATIH
ncbi:hypothetical protein TNCV_166351 [Trichonephila clavipes]|nr:hypothetical protein TNCV_166351 [Trichonephila clavipes]